MALHNQESRNRFLPPLTLKYFQLKIGRKVTSGWNGTSSQVHKTFWLKWSKNENLEKSEWILILENDTLNYELLLLAMYQIKEK